MSNWLKPHHTEGPVCRRCGSPCAPPQWHGVMWRKTILIQYDALDFIWNELCGIFRHRWKTTWLNVCWHISVVCVIILFPRWSYVNLEYFSLHHIYQEHGEWESCYSIVLHLRTNWSQCGSWNITSDCSYLRVELFGIMKFYPHTTLSVCVKFVRWWDGEMVCHPHLEQVHNTTGPWLRIIDDYFNTAGERLFTSILKQLPVFAVDCGLKMCGWCFGYLSRIFSFSIYILACMNSHKCTYLLFIVYSCWCGSHCYVLLMCVVMNKTLTNMGERWLHQSVLSKAGLFNEAIRFHSNQSIVPMATIVFHGNNSNTYNPAGNIKSEDESFFSLSVGHICWYMCM